MPHFTLHLLQNAPIVRAVISVSQARAAALTAAGKAIPSMIPVQALVDTGASSTCLDPYVISTLELTPTGSVPCHTPSTGSQPAMMNQYDVGIIIPGPTPTHAPFIVGTLPVVETALFTAQGFHALIGRDILQHCVLIYNGSLGQFTLAY